MNERKLPDPDKYYSAAAIIREGFLGDWLKSKMSLTTLLREEKAQEIFKPIIKQGMRNMSFRVKGQTLIDVIALIEKGELRL